MRVRATQRGFLGSLREAGDVFDIAEEQFSETWMEQVEAATPERGRRKASKEEVAAIEAAKREAGEKLLQPPPQVDYDPITAAEGNT